MIDRSFAAEIQAEFGLNYLPSAFQIRCGGCKGVVSVEPHKKLMKSNGGKYKVLLRPSQNKFESFEGDESDFDVVMFSAPSSVKLHRSFISLLMALARDQGKADVVEKRLNELLTDSFMEITDALMYPVAFKKVLESLPRYFPVSDLSAEHLFREPFLRSMVEAYMVSVASKSLGFSKQRQTKNFSESLNNKCQIPLPDNLGRCALGIVDTLGVLKPGEVFFQYTVDIGSKAANPVRKIHTGPIGITKSPMYHLGDIQYVTAVEHPKLQHLYDVIVFPRLGSRPIPDKIGGGDLDGDMYVVFWDEALMLEHAAPSPYLAADTSKIPTTELQDLHHEHAEFRIQYEQLNNLEKLSNFHLNHITIQHPNHEDVERIALKADTAVNYFKSGYPADEITPNEFPVFHPVFMGKRHEPAYTSSHILCQLHRRCDTFFNLMSNALKQSQLKRSERQMSKPPNLCDESLQTFKEYKIEIFVSLPYL